MAVGISVWVFLPVFRGPEAARRDVGTHRLAIGTIVSVLLLNVLLTIPLADYVRDAGTTLIGFTIAALATQVPLLLVVYVRLIVPRAVTWGELGLRPLPLLRALSIGLAFGMIG